MPVTVMALNRANDDRPAGPRVVQSPDARPYRYRSRPAQPDRAHLQANADGRRADLADLVALRAGRHRRRPRGRATPQALHVAAWPYVTLGAGYGLLAVAMTLIGAGRHRRLKRAARSASDAALDDRTVTAFTAGGTLLALATIALVLAQS